jgi:anaerobic ribonucleoside-triphosphate reductase activating protein
LYNNISIDKGDIYMRYAGLVKNDVTAGNGICTTLYMQGCHHKCKGCHNPETWDFFGGNQIIREELIMQILESLVADGIHRSFCVMGGEPLAPENLIDTFIIVARVKHELPDTEIYLWTGDLFSNLLKQYKDNIVINGILDNIDYIIDGEYIEELRDVTLRMRGSSNQNIYNVAKSIKKKKPIKEERFYKMEE